MNHLYTHWKVLLTKLSINNEYPLQHGEGLLRLVGVEQVARALGEGDEEQHHQQAGDPTRRHEDPPRGVLEVSPHRRQVEPGVRDDEECDAWNIKIILKVYFDGIAVFL